MTTFRVESVFLYFVKQLKSDLEEYDIVGTYDEKFNFIYGTISRKETPPETIKSFIDYVDNDNMPFAPWKTPSKQSENPYLSFGCIEGFEEISIDTH